MAIAAAIATPLTAGVAWIAKKLWTLLEAHAERRTKGIEAIAPSIKTVFDEMRKHVTDHADEHLRAVEGAERKIVEAVGAAKAEIVDKIALNARLERVEAAVLTAKGQEDPSVPERPETRQPRAVQPLRESRPSIASR